MDVIISNQDLICNTINPYEVSSILRYWNVLNQYDISCIDDQSSEVEAGRKIIQILKESTEPMVGIKFLDAIRENSPLLGLYVPEILQGLRLCRPIGTDKFLKVLLHENKVVVDIRKYKVSKYKFAPG